ncbi:hypothetical protein [Cryptosporangium aurantiacum]|uniref:Uncharacterized protein n=1 Tax=Cryptosporangium aurantiacum TaxID=134849 RepID=A0A1M7QDV8_9ACTN|nr:hypothetical protein [Cryptosporangium aurantiacum]SHN28932.1 hypothetical protein SAMN05443668_104512 [Cryptosporangium aurantiacum]
MVVVSAGPARLTPDRDTAEVARVVWTALTRQRQQLHQGRRCTASRSPLLRNAHSQHCLVCDELALDAQERVVAAWQRQPAREPWTQARIVSCAQSVLADRVRTRLSVAGLVARPERWLDQRSFLPHVDPTGRVLLVALIVSVGYYTCIPTSGGRVRLGPAVVAPLVDGVRRGAFASALTRAWPTDAEPDLAACAGHLAAALIAWRDARPEQYAALVDLAEANRTVLSLDVAGLRSDVEFTHLAGGPAGDDVAEVVIEQRGRWVVGTEHVAAAGALLGRFLDRVRELAREAEQRPRSGVLAEDGELSRRPPSGPAPGELRMLLVEEAEKLAAEGNGPAWLWQLRDRPAVVTALIDHATELF